MDKSALHHVPESHAKYIALVENRPLQEAFNSSLKQLDAIDLQALEKAGKTTYAPGKWTVHDILQHLTDSERIFCYRALRFARRDQTELAGFDQDNYALYAQADNRVIEDLLVEYKEVHRGSARLFQTFNESMLLQTGTCSGVKMSVLALGYTILGHKIHHFKIMKEKYGISL